MSEPSQSRAQGPADGVIPASSADVGATAGEDIVAAPQVRRVLAWEPLAALRPWIAPLMPWMVVVTVLFAVAGIIEESGLTRSGWGWWLARTADVALGAALIVLIVQQVLGKRKLEAPNPQDAYGGMALIWLALIAFWASGDLPGMRGFAFGPGTAPRLFAGLLAALGSVVAVNGLLLKGPAVERYDILGPILITTAYVGFTFAQGIAPLIFSAVAGLVGIVVAVIGLLGKRRHYVRGPLFITISVLFFAATVRPLGLVICSFVTIMICAAAAEDVRWRETVLVTIGLTVFCALLFPYALNLPMQLWPQFWR